MEKPCHKCGQPVEEGIAFCRQCSAPQIRVVMAEPMASPPPPGDTASYDEEFLPASHRIPETILTVRWSQAIRPCALAALAATVVMALGLNPWVAMVSVGFLAVVFYRQWRPGVPIRALAGAKIGALSGVLWFAMASSLVASLVIFFHKSAELRSELVTRLQQAASQTSDPQALALFERFKTPDGLELLMLFGLITAFFAAVILAGIGGALGGAILGRRNKTQL
jgi:hypothetical protein